MNPAMFKPLFVVLVTLFTITNPEESVANNTYQACLAACVATDSGSADIRKQRCEAQCAALKGD